MCTSVNIRKCLSRLYGTYVDCHCFTGFAFVGCIARLYVLEKRSSYTTDMLFVSMVYITDLLKVHFTISLAIVG